MGSIVTGQVPVDYKYDVFFSYKRHELTLDWTRQVRQRFEFWLSQELAGRAALIFVDEDCIEIGQAWPSTLSDALRNSRCMVCVWSPTYFQSTWCMSEWRSFRQREEIEGQPRYRLIAPMKFHDGEHFPDEARSTQWLDVSEYATTLPAFWTTSRALELESRLKAFAREVAQMIAEAPPFRPDWPLVTNTLPVPQPIIGLERL
jgi:hypothetical protein